MEVHATADVCSSIFAQNAQVSSTEMPATGNAYAPLADKLMPGRPCRAVMAHQLGLAVQLAFAASEKPQGSDARCCIYMLASAGMPVPGHVPHKCIVPLAYLAIPHCDALTGSKTEP